jgi:beta-N-acetylhexosaminidase
MSDSLERLANGCILAGFAGTTAPEWLSRELADGLGGVVLFARNVSGPEQLQALTGSLRVSAATVVAIDEEGGDVTRLEASRGSSLPGALGLGTIDDVALTEQVARVLADELRAAGITLNLAPVADINVNPLNPVIGVRSFGSDPALVSRHVAAFVTGLQAGGVAACAKHFPGHGATDVDSHLGLPVVSATRDELLEVELAPFRAAIAAGTRAIMSAHLVVPAVDNVPATLSRAQLTGLLRDELGFTGTIVTDALEMKAVSGTVGMEEGAVQALLAGADALCLGHDIDDGHVSRVRVAIVAAVREGRLAEGRVAEAAGRVASSHVPVAAARAADAPPFAELGLTAARRALLVQGTVADARPLLLVDLEGTLSVAAGLPSHDLASILGELGADVEAIQTTESRLDQALEAVHASPDRRPVVVSRDVDRHPWQHDAAAAILAAGPGGVVVDVGYPAQSPAVQTHPVLNGRITTFGAGRASLTAAAELLLGAR